MKITKLGHCCLLIETKGKRILTDPGSYTIPNVALYANSSVAELLTKEGIQHTQINHGDKALLGEIALDGIGEKHAQMHSTIPLSSNLGFFIENKLWYPGDAFTNPNRSVEVLALPVSGPWMKLSDAIDYALLLKPKKVFPVHDGTRFGSAHVLPAKILAPQGIEFVVMVEGDQKKF